MHSFHFTDRTYKNSPANTLELRYLILGSESKDVAAASRGMFGFRNRYMTKRRVIRTIRRLRRTRA